MMVRRWVLPRRWKKSTLNGPQPQHQRHDDTEKKHQDTQGFGRSSRVREGGMGVSSACMKAAWVKTWRWLMVLFY